MVNAAAHRPHDLLWVDDAAALMPLGALPAWATPAWLSAWLTTAPVVVRRAPTPSPGCVPVGLRGATRSARCAAHTMADRVTRRLTPEDLAQRVREHGDRVDWAHACIRSLVRLVPVLDALGLSWGVTGSVGFSLASGIDVLRAESDLDLLVRAPDRVDAAGLRAVAAQLGAVSCRVDVQVEGPHGAFALGEWLRTGGPVLLKTTHGPVLCGDPWQTATPGTQPLALA